MTTRRTRTARALCVIPDCYVPHQHAKDCDGSPADPCGGCLPGMAADGLLICRHHLNAGIRDLQRLPQLDRALTLALVMYSSPGLSQRVNVSPSPGLDLDERVMEARDYVRGRLSDLAGFVSVERGMTPPPANVAAMSAWLLRQAPWMAANKVLAHQWTRTVASLASEARRRAYPSGNRRWPVTGAKCTKTVDVDPAQHHPHPAALGAACPTELPCPGDLYAIVSDRADLLPVLRCTADDSHEITAVEWQMVGRRAKGMHPEAVKRLLTRIRVTA